MLLLVYAPVGFFPAGFFVPVKLTNANVSKKYI
jgi:hypothetical protein